MKKYLIQLFKGERPLKDVWHYIVGTYRNMLYGGIVEENKKPFLIRRFIHEQIVFRKNNMNVLCYNNGECIKCGCSTLALQMCNKSCEGNCYPKMLSKRLWKSVPKSFKTMKRLD
jgi:hypothetical protein